jgi:hypothetical protein
LKNNGFYLSAITPVNVNSIRTQLKYLLVSEEQAYSDKVLSYSQKDFVDVSIDFWLKIGCGCKIAMKLKFYFLRY